jgi:nucleoside-diphosphate-sugar epimerase
VGTTQLLDALSRSAPVPDQLVLASSRAVYGEGAWRCGAQTFYPRPRSHAQLLAGIWESKGPHRRTCGAASEVRRKDGRIVRGFVFIDDVVDALFAAIEGPTTEPRCLDIGSGIATTIDELARKIAASCDAPAPIVVPKFRDGDVRAASCTIEPAKDTLCWHPKWALENGLRALLAWIGEQPELSFEPSDHTHAPGRAAEHDSYR